MIKQRGFFLRVKRSSWDCEPRYNRAKTCPDPSSPSGHACFEDGAPTAGTLCDVGAACSCDYYGDLKVAATSRML